MASVQASPWVVSLFQEEQLIIEGVCTGHAADACIWLRLSSDKMTFSVSTIQKSTVIRRDELKLQIHVWGLVFLLSASYMVASDTQVGHYIGKATVQMIGWGIEGF